MFGRLTAQLVDIEKRQRALDAERIEVLAKWQHSDEWRDDGSASAAARLARTTDVPGYVARDRVRISAVTSSMPHTEAAMDDLGAHKVRLLANAINERTRPYFERDEAALVEQALQLSPDLLALLLRRWQHDVDGDGANMDADSRHDGRYLEVTSTFGGDVLLRGRLDPEAGAIVRTVLQRIADELYRSDRRSHVEETWRGVGPQPAISSAERMADAIEEMARRADATIQAEADGATVVPNRPLVTVVMEADDDGAVRARLDDGTPIPVSDATRIACDAFVARAINRKGLVPLKLGRAVRDPSEAQRRALSTIWRTCAHPSCDRPFAWCHLHHVLWWESGGPTDIDLLLPLCKKHHRLHHKGVFDIRRRPDGSFLFLKADGTEIGPANPTASQLFGSLRDLARAS